MRENLIEAFPSVTDKELTDSYIEDHNDLMWYIPDIPLIRAVPLYMLWCIDHSTEEGALVFDNTISALNKYSRSNKPSNTSQNFKFSCSKLQVQVVMQFLQWCKTSLVSDYEPTLSRAIKNWRAVNKGLQSTSLSLGD